MKNPLLALLVTAGVLAAGSPSVAHEHADSDADQNTLVGVWDLMVTLRRNATDCTTAPVIGVGPNPFPQSDTFHRGGTLTGVSRFTFTDLSGNALRFCATMEGTRLTLP